MEKLNLNEEELRFMDRCGLGLDDFYDARGERKCEYHYNAKREGCYYVINNYCQCGHRFKTRGGGHCIVCRPSAMAFEKRYSKDGAIYIASNGEYCKVGVVDNNSFSPEVTLAHRKNSLNGEGGYGGVTGWEIVAWFKVDCDLGRKEKRIHDALSKYSTQREYYHDGDYRLAREVLKCSVDEAMNTIDRLLGGVDWQYGI